MVTVMLTKNGVGCALMKITLTDETFPQLCETHFRTGFRVGGCVATSPDDAIAELITEVEGPLEG